jgi:hypothetical protein
MGRGGRIVRQVSILLLLLPGACAGPGRRPAPATIPPAPTREATRDLLARLEAAFYIHWGAVETTPTFKSFGPGHVPWLREQMDSNQDLSLMAMRVLERMAPGERVPPAAKAILYSGALARERNFTRWGLISPSGFFPGVYGDEVMRLGREALEPLGRLLGDRRRAPVEGGTAETVNRMQGDRVCDYAWVLLCTLLDRPLAYHAEAGKRDPQIRELEAWLARRR